MLEDTRTGVPELLVVSDVQVYWPVCKYLRSLSLDETLATLSSWQGTTALHARHTIGYTQH